MKASLLVVVLIAVLVLCLWYAWRRAAAHTQAVRRHCEDAIGSIYYGVPIRPVLEVRGCYGFHAFQVVFQNRKERDAASVAGLNERFGVEVQRICSDEGSAQNPFDWKRAVHFGYLGEVDDISAGLAAERQ